MLFLQVVEVVSGDCVVVADDSVPYGSPLAERRVNLSSIRCPKIGNPRRDEKPAPYAREAKEFLRTRLIGRQVWRHFLLHHVLFSYFLVSVDVEVLFLYLFR